MPDGTELIEDYAFGRCSSLESITIPKEVTAIDINAFIGCDSLKTVYYKGAQEEWENLLNNTSEGNDVLKTVTIHFSEE